MSASERWFGFVLGGRQVGWQQLVRRELAAAGEVPLQRREVLTVFRAGDELVVSAFFAELPEGEPLAWRRFGTLTRDGDRWVEAAAFERRPDGLLLPGGELAPLPEVCYPGQLLLELAAGLLRTSRRELTATPLNDGDGTVEAPALLRLSPSLIGPPSVTHRVDELSEGGGEPRRSVLLAPDGRPERQVWGPGTWSGPPTTRALATAVGPTDVPSLRRA